MNAVFLLGEAALNSLVRTRAVAELDDQSKHISTWDGVLHHFADHISILHDFTELPLVPDRILLPLDGALRHFPMDCPCSNSNLVNFPAPNSRAKYYYLHSCIS